MLPEPTRCVTSPPTTGLSPQRCGPPIPTPGRPERHSSSGRIRAAWEKASWDRDMVLNLVVLGFALSLDNFRTAVILGPLRFAWRRALEIAVVFGFFDGAAPLVGILLGHDVSQEIGGEIADHAGATALGLYGLYLIVRALRTATQEELEAEHRWSIFGLPLPLSLDNV